MFEGDVMKILLVPDIVGWVVEDMALNLKRVLDDDFDVTIKYSDQLAAKHGKKILDWATDYNEYDILFIMLPSYIPENLPDISKVVTCFHGGPGTEGQADMLQRFGYKDMRIAYVSEQTRWRVMENPFTNTKKEKVPLTQQIDENWLKRTKLQLTEKDSMQIITDPQTVRQWVEVQVKYTRTGFGFNELYFTPHGVDVEMFKQKRLNQDFICGYAGWANYLLGAQDEHRRGRWIMEAWKKLKNVKFNLAVGLKEHDHNNLKKFNAAWANPLVRAGLWEHKDMPSYYTQISTYLVPDARAGGPVPVLEAGAMGIPVVCSKAGLCGDMIEDNVHGKVIEEGPHTFERFVDAIRWMQSHNQKREKMGKNLREYIYKNRRWEDVKEYWVKFLLGK
jgi:glycosyltransferase involved in cell wall biosynthesis